MTPPSTTCQEIGAVLQGLGLEGVDTHPPTHSHSHTLSLSLTHTHTQPQRHLARKLERSVKDLALKVAGLICYHDQADDTPLARLAEVQWVALPAPSWDEVGSTLRGSWSGPSKTWP